MNRDNVVPFVSDRGALARRGAPDKARMRPATVEIDCPHCGAVLCIDAGALAADPEILCAGCDASFAFFHGKAAAD